MAVFEQSFSKRGAKPKGQFFAIGDIIAEAMEKVTKDGVITIEDAKGIDTNVKVVEGMQFDRGYISPYFVTDTEKMNAPTTILSSLSMTRKSAR